MHDSLIRKHQHLILTGHITNPPTNCEYITDWLIELVKKIDMKILMGPISTYSDMAGNRGLTGVVVIETSHIAVHVWDECNPALIELDIFSCKDFNIDTVVQHMKEFGLNSINFKSIDRTKSLTEEKLFVVYSTENKINNKKYIGVHGAYQANDGYLGSGILLKQAVKKYGKENFQYSIIKICNSKKEAYDLERQIVNHEFIKDPATYNLALGGIPSPVEQGNNVCKKISDLSINKPKNLKWITNGIENMLVKLELAEHYILTENWNYGRVITEEHKSKLSDAATGRPSHRIGKNIPNDVKEKTSTSMREKFKNGYTVHNAGKKLYVIDGKKIWK